MTTNTFFNPEDDKHLTDLDKNEKYVKKGFWDKTKKIAAKVPFVLDSIAVYYCAIDQKTPIFAKGIALAALAYVINPFDVMPDAIPALGLTDDAAAMVVAIKTIDANLKDEHRKKAEEAMLDIKN